MESNTLPIFVIGRFRSGTTVLWNILRNIKKVWAFYEPCNDNLLVHLKNRTVPMASHAGVDDYWSEYQNLIGDIGKFYDKKFGVTNLCLRDDCEEEDLKNYIDRLITSVPADFVPVLQFNRMDYRIGWLRKNYPDSKIIYIYREPRAQWKSLVKEHEKSNCLDPGINTGYDLLVWRSQLSMYFPKLFSINNLTSYHVHYLLRKISFYYGQKYSDLFISLEDDLWKDPHTTIKRILNCIGLDGDVTELSKLVDVKNAITNVENTEFYRAAEIECDVVLNSHKFEKNISSGTEIFNSVKNTVYKDCVDSLSLEISRHRDVIISLQNERKIVHSQREKESIDYFSQVDEIRKKEKIAREYALSLETSVKELMDEVQSQKSHRAREGVDFSAQLDALVNSDKVAKEYVSSLKIDIEKVMEDKKSLEIELNRYKSHWFFKFFKNPV